MNRLEEIAHKTIAETLASESVPSWLASRDLAQVMKEIDPVMYGEEILNTIDYLWHESDLQEELREWFEIYGY